MGDFDFKTTHFEVRGFKELYRAIDHLPEAVKKSELEPILVAALIPMRDLARRLAPDDPLTGPPWNLPSSIEVSVRQRTGRSKFDRALGRYDARAYMGPTKYGYPQAVFAEFGTTQRRWKPPGAEKSTGVMTARPYMRPSWDSDKHTALRILADGLGDRLEMIIRKYGTSASAV